MQELHSKKTPGDKPESTGPRPWSTRGTVVYTGFSTELGPGLVGLYRLGGGKSNLLTADMEAVAGLTDFALTN